MTRDEMKTVLAYLIAAYPSFVNDSTDMTALTNIWYDAFNEYNAVIVMAAAKNFTRSSKYAPTIAGLQEQIDLLLMQHNDADLWRCIEKAIRNGIYHSKEEYAKLPQECQAFVGSAEALRDIALTETGVTNTVIKGQFLRQIPQIRQRQEARARLPAEEIKVIEDSAHKSE